MKLSRSFVGPIVVIALAAWAIWALFPSDEKIIRSRLSDLAKATSISANESIFVRLAKNDKLRGFFSKDVEVHFEPEGKEVQHINGRGELVAIAAAARSQLKQARIQLLDIFVKIAPEKESATAYMTLLGDLNNEKNAVSQELKMRLKKIDGDWLITRVDTIKTLH